MTGISKKSLGPDYNDRNEFIASIKSLDLKSALSLDPNWTIDQRVAWLMIILDNCSEAAVNNEELLGSTMFSLRDIITILKNKWEVTINWEKLTLKDLWITSLDTTKELTNTLDDWELIIDQTGNPLELKTFFSLLNYFDVKNIEDAPAINDYLDYLYRGLIENNIWKLDKRKRHLDLIERKEILDLNLIRETKYYNKVINIIDTDKYNYNKFIMDSEYELFFKDASRNLRWKDDVAIRDYLAGLPIEDLVKVVSTEKEYDRYIDTIRQSDAFGWIISGKIANSEITSQLVLKVKKMEQETDRIEAFARSIPMDELVKLLKWRMSKTPKEIEKLDI